MGFTFNEQSKQEFSRWEKKFPANKEGKQSLVIPGLWIAQRQNGWVNQEVVKYVAEMTETEPLHVWGVATFYTMFHKKEVGKTLFQFCTNIACGLYDGDKFMMNTCKKLGISPGETTSDGRFTVLEVECLGACGEAPVVQINDKYHTHMTEQELENLINQYGSKVG